MFSRYFVPRLAHARSKPARYTKSATLRLTGLLLAMAMVLAACGAQTQASQGGTGVYLPTSGITTIDQSTGINLKSHVSGKPALIVGWATWCPICRAQMPYIQQLHEEYEGRVNVIGVNVQEPANTIIPYLKENNFTFTMLSDASGAATGKLGISGLPTSLIVDKNGQVVHTIVGAIMPQHQVTQKLDNLIKQ